jgi:predicted RNA-binding protein with EMAP domain
VVNPIHAIGLASSALNGVAKSFTDLTKTREQHRTMRHQNKIGAVNDVAQCLQEIVAAYHQYQTVHAEEQTKRRDIEAWEKTTLKEIENRRDVLLAFLEHSFDERAKNFQDLFKVLDQALTSEDNENVGLVLEKITELAKSSPLEGLKDLSVVQAALVDSNHEWKF